MNTPSITSAQVGAVIAQVIAVAVAFGVDLDTAQQSSLLGLSGIIAIAIIWADQQIRKNRAQNAEAINATKTNEVV